VYIPGCPPRPEQLIEGVMAIQRIIDQEGIPPMNGGKRQPLGLVMQPTHVTKPQPVGVTVGG
jgi:NADH-quinone oxidoreductase subunit B